MDNAVKIVFTEDMMHCLSIPDVRFIMGNRMADNLLYPVNGFLAAVDIIINNDRFMPGFAKLHTGMGADESGSAR
jgi:hypothetical protein